MTFSDLKNFVSYGLDDLNFGYFTDVQVGVWLNNAQREVQKRLIKAGQNYYVKPVQTTTVVNQYDYVLPDDFKKVNRLALVLSGTSPNESIAALTPMTLNQQDLVTPGSGTPKTYLIKRNRISIFPAPDSALTLRLFYTYLVTDMSLGSDIPDVPAAYHELLGLLAMQDGFIKDGRVPELLVKKIGEYEREMDSDANERRQDTGREIVERGDSSTSGGFTF